MGKEKQPPADYSFELRQSMESFISAFWEEFKNQEKSLNRASERRMRALLRSFPKEITKQYVAKSLGKTQ